MMVKQTVIFFLLAYTACTPPATTGNDPKDTTIVIAADTIAPTRTKINPSPVTSYTEKVPDELNDWKFEVSLYETSQTFRYMVRVRYKELRITDSLQVPDLGILPEVVIHKGKDPLSCIIGFLDKKDEFKEYKLVRIKNDQLKISTINHYYVGRTRMKVAGMN